MHRRLRTSVKSRAPATISAAVSGSGTDATAETGAASESGGGTIGAGKNAGLPTVKFVPLGKAAKLVTNNVPAATLVPLPKVLLPLRTSVPGPTFVIGP